MVPNPRCFPVLGLVTFLSLSPSTRAATIFNNFGAGDSFSDIGLLLQGETVGTIGNVDQAAAFTVGGGSYIVTSVSLGIGVSPGPTIVGTGPLDIIIAADAAGLPGATLKTYSLNVNTTGKQIVTGSGGADLQLNAGTTYWIIANAKGSFDGGWNDNTIGDVGPTAGASNPVGNPATGPWNLHNVSSVDHFAFRVEGRLVPEPCTATLLGGGLVGFMGVVRRRRGAAGA